MLHPVLYPEHLWDVSEQFDRRRADKRQGILLVQVGLEQERPLLYLHVRCHVHRDGHWNWQDQAHFHRGLQEGTQGDEIIPRILAKTSQVPPTHLGSDIHGYWEPGFKDMTSQDVMWWHFTSLFPFIGWGLRFLMCNVGDFKTIHLTEYLYLCFFFVAVYFCLWICIRVFGDSLD